MTCPQCRAENPADKKFCGDCGARLEDAGTSPLSSQLRDEIQSAVRARLTDQKVVEVETTQAVVARLLEWAKLFAYCVAIPLAVLGVILAVLGISNYADFSGKVKHANEQIEGTLKEAQEKAKQLQVQADTVAREYAEISKKLPDAKVLAGQIEELTSQVRQIGKKVGVDFKPSSDLTPALRESLQSSLDSFQMYLERLGYTRKRGRISIAIDPKLNNTMFNLASNEIILGKAFAEDRQVVMFTYMQHVLNSLHTTDGQSSMFSAVAIALADYFPCSFLNDSRVGPVAAKALSKAASQPYIRNLENERKFTDIAPDADLFGAAEGWGGAFWEIRKSIGQTKADQLLFSTWTSLQPANLRSREAATFATKIIDRARLSEASAVEALRGIFERRGLRI